MRAASVSSFSLQLIAGGDHRIAGDIGHAARAHAAIARCRVGVADNHAHPIDADLHPVGDQLAQDRMRARALIDAWTDN